MHLIAALSWFFEPAHWITILTVAAGLGFVVFVHELGHFLVAKACGVKCEKFYIGFDIGGWKIVHFQWGETEYGIGILPLGGYVKMLGQDDNPARIAEESKRSKLNDTSATPEHAPPLTHGDLPPEPVSDPHIPYDPRSYMAQSVPKRMAIISAGVIMNVIFAFIMASIAYAIGVKETPCIVRAVVPGGAAWQAGLQPGDQVKRIGKIENPRFKDLQTGVTLGDLANGVEFEIVRPSTDVKFTAVLHPDASLGVPMIGVVGPWKHELIDDKDGKPTLKFSPARKAEPRFEPGDRFLKINDATINDQIDVQRALARYADDKVTITVARADENDASGAGTNQPASNDLQKLSGGKTVEIDVEPTPLRDFGLVMTMDPISAVQPDSPAKQAGIEPGDRILAIDDRPVGNPLTLPERMRRAALDGKSVSITVERQIDSASTTKTIPITPRVPETSDELLPTNPMSAPALGIAYKVWPKVTAIVPGSPAEAEHLKLQPGEEIISARYLPSKEADAAKNNTDPNDQFAPPKIEFDDKDPAWPYFIWEVLTFADPNARWELEVRSGKQTRKIELASSDLKDESGRVVHSPQRGFIFQPMFSVHVADSFGSAMRLGGRETLDNLLLVYRFLQKIGQKQISVKLLGGPVEIFRQAGRSAEQGWSDFLLFLTMLSANLAVINFLPIPVLDGGHMVFLAYELVRRKPASERVVVAFTYAGLIFILSLMVFVLALDTGLISRR